MPLTGLVPIRRPDVLSPTMKSPAAAIGLQSASAQRLRTNATPVVTYPLTLACWFRLRSDVTGTLMAVTDDLIGAGDYCSIFTIAGGTVRAANFTSTQQQAETTKKIQPGRWHHAVATFSSTSLRSIYLDGYWDTDTDTNSVAAMAGIDHVDIGGLSRGAAVELLTDADIAHACIWSSVLNQHDAHRLYKGDDPRNIGGGTLERWWPLLQGSALKDYAGANPLTAYNAPGWGSAFTPFREKTYFLPTSGGLVGGAFPVQGPRRPVVGVSGTGSGSLQYAKEQTDANFVHQKGRASWSFWMRLHNADTDEIGTVIANNGITTAKVGFAIWYENRTSQGGPHKISASVTNGSARITGIPGTADNFPTDTNWHHVVLTWDHDGDDRMYLYVDGAYVEDDETVGSVGSPVLGYSTHDLTILGSGNSAFYADFDLFEAGVWDRVLSTAEIRSLAMGFDPMNLGPRVMLAAGEDWSGHPSETITKTPVVRNATGIAPVAFTGVAVEGGVRRPSMVIPTMEAAAVVAASAFPYYRYYGAF